MASRDVVVVGAGINGLSAAALLARQGRAVTVLEANDVPGGAVRTEEITLPGFRHDLFAMNLGLFAGGPVMARLGPDLVRHGLDLVATDRPFCSVFPDDTLLGVHTDPATTEAGLPAADLAAWRQLRARLGDWLPHVGALMGADLPSAAAVRALLAARRRLGWQGVGELARLGLQSTRDFTDEHFADPRTRALLATWGMHLDFGPDVAGGALFSFLETFGGEQFGMVIGRGGARSLVDSLVAVIVEAGGEVRCGTRVTAIDVVDRQVRGVRTSDGSKLAARRVVANLHPQLLAGLLPDAALPTSARAGAAGFRPGLATMMIHLATDAPPPWTASPAAGFNYVHVAGYVDDMARTYQQAAAGQLPDHPALVVGQPTVSDPSRAPDGRHVLWIQVRVVPEHPTAGGWGQVGEPYADQVLGVLERYAPGLGSTILSRTVLTPPDLTRYNANLVGGDSLGGSHHPAQYFFLRPAPGWTRHRTPVKGLLHCGASTWPGAGVSGTSGFLAAAVC